MRGPRDPTPAAARGGAESRVPADDVLQFAKVVSTSLGRVTSAVLYNVEGPAGEPNTGMDVYGQTGLVVRPPPPDQTGGVDRHADILCVRTGDGLVPVLGRDVRLNQFFPNPQPGDVALVGYGSNFVKLGIDGRISIVTTKDGTPNGAMMQIQLNPDGFAVIGDWGKLSLDEGGLHVLTHTGARLDLGGIGGIPLLDQLGLTSYASLAAAIVKLEATTIILGPVSGVAEPVTKSLALEALLVLIALSATSTAAALTALGAIPTNSGASAAIGLAVTDLAAVAAGISAALVPASLTSIQSGSTSAT